MIELSNLVELELNNTGITQIPIETGELQQLQRLSMQGNKITSAFLQSDWLSNFVNLTLLDLSDNLLDRLPASLGTLDSLKELRLEYNKIRRLRSTV